MSRKQIWRMTVDLAMTVILLLLMGYSRIGETGFRRMYVYAIHTASYSEPQMDSRDF